MKRETWAKIIIGIVSILTLGIVLYNSALFGIIPWPFSSDFGKIIVFLLVPCSLVLIFLWAAKFVSFTPVKKGRKQSSANDYVGDKTLSGTLASLFSNWKFWLAAILGSILLFVLISAKSREGFDTSIWGLTLFALPMIGYGFSYFLGKLEVVNPSGIWAVWGWSLKVIGAFMLLFYWPIIFVAIVAMLSKRLNKRLLIVIGIITLLLLVAGFYGCAMQAADVAKGPW